MIYNAARDRRLSTKIQVDTSKLKKIVEIQAMIYNVARVRSFSTKLQVNTCKSKEDRPAHVQLHTL